MLFNIFFISFILFIFDGKVVNGQNCVNCSRVEVQKNRSSRVISPLKSNRFLFNGATAAFGKNGRKDDKVKLNYLNYKDVYGLRFSPTLKAFEIIENEVKEVVDSEASPEINLLIHPTYGLPQPNNISDFYTNSIETELERPAQFLNVLNDARNFATESTVKNSIKESSNHIMKPPDMKLESTLNFLALRLKKLLYFSADENRPESKISPQLSALGRFLNLFHIIKFENIPCTTSRRPLRQLNGICYHEVECKQLGGIAVDQCASGFGVCCIFKASCNMVSSQNVTYFESPNFPRSYQKRMLCSLTVLIPNFVKQLRIEFLFFELLPPTEGNCVNDQFIVSGQALNSRVPPICGINTGQHMFVDVSDTLQQKVILAVASKTDEHRAFSIKITQLADNLAPQNCLQYHENSEGFIKTFNYDDISKIVQVRQPSYFNNLNYAICIKRNPGFCQITYTNDFEGREDVFELVNIDENGFSVVPQNQAGAEIFSCADDFIAVNQIRLCGYRLNDGSLTADFSKNIPIRDIMIGPIVLPFKSNAEVVGRGMRIYYTQEKCTTEEIVTTQSTTEQSGV